MKLDELFGGAVPSEILNAVYGSLEFKNLESAKAALSDMGFCEIERSGEYRAASQSSPVGEATQHSYLSADYRKGEEPLRCNDMSHNDRFFSFISHPVSYGHE